MKSAGIFAVIAGVLVASGLYFFPAKNTLNYTALGDSIAEGYSAEQKQGYTYKLDKYYEGMYKNVIYNNLASSGDTSADLLNKLKTSDELKESVKTADVITISIGGNDLLSGIGGLISGNFISLNESVKTFSRNWNDIINILRDLNLKAEVYAIDLYNPIGIGDYYNGFKFDSSLRQIADNYINEFNNIITDEEFLNKYKYKVVDIHSVFEENLIVGNPLTDFKKSADPHPNNEGHELIFKRHLTVISKR